MSNAEGANVSLTTRGEPFFLPDYMGKSAWETEVPETGMGRNAYPSLVRAWEAGCSSFLRQLHPPGDCVAVGVLILGVGEFSFEIDPAVLLALIPVVVAW